MTADVRWLDEREAGAWRSFMSMQEALTEFLERQLRTRCGLSGPDFQVLAHLSEAPDGRLRSLVLGRRLHWEKSRLSQHLTRMAARGLVVREPCLEDQRGAVIAITPAGRALVEAAAPQHVADVRAAVIDHLDDAELATLAAVSERVRARLEVLARGGED